MHSKLTFTISVRLSVNRERLSAFFNVTCSLFMEKTLVCQINQIFVQFKYFQHCFHAFCFAGFNSAGMQYSCYVECQTGYMYNNGDCEDIDECASNPCHEHATCNNTESIVYMGCRVLCQIINHQLSFDRHYV